MGRRRLAALITVSLAVTLIVMDGSIVNEALPTLVRALGGASNSQLQWIVDAYILVFATLLLSMGNAADRFGRRRLLVMGSLVFGATSVGAAYARTPEALVAWRAAMGVGAAMIFPATLAGLAVGRTGRHRTVRRARRGAAVPFDPARNGTAPGARRPQGLGARTHHRNRGADSCPRSVQEDDEGPVTATVVASEPRCPRVAVLPARRATR